LGEAELIEWYRYISDQEVGIHKATARVKTCGITVKAKPTGVESLKSVVCALSDALDDALHLLSFLSRKRMSWYAAEVVFVAESEIRAARVRRQQWLGRESKQQKVMYVNDLLVVPQSLRDGVFPQLLAKYETSPFRASIDQTILHLFGTYEEAYLEAKLGTAYTALESIVAGTGKNEDDKVNCFIDKKTFRLLSNEVRKIIRSKVKEKNIADRLINKLSRQRPFSDRLWKLIEKNEIDVARLWPLGVDIQSDLHEVVNRRHSYVHTGKVDYDKIYVDFRRVQGLVELWILKLLDCPEETINNFAFREASQR
jgi:hypothetical protein